MRLRNIAGSDEVMEKSPYVVNNPGEHKGKWEKFFGNSNPIHIEIGMGKGKFLYQMALLYPEINYIGMEKYSSVVLRAVQKMEEAPLPNLFFLRENAEEVTEMFAPGELGRIYLNFSDPWPKDRHARRRLPSREFLARYRQVLKKGAWVEFKTDNRELFEFALGELEPAGFQALEQTFNLHEDKRLSEGNVMTEYEEKFSSQGNPICKYIVIPVD